MSLSSSMSASFGMGDLEGNFKKLTRLLLKVHYPTLFARERVLEGDTATLIPMLRYALTGMSHKLARKLLNAGYEIYATSDAKFVECVYKVCIHAFHYHPALQLLQFLHPPRGYAERKMVLVACVIQHALHKHAELAREHKDEASMSASAKKKQREAVQARLTQARKTSDATVQQDEQQQQQQRPVTANSQRRRSVSTERTAPSSARPRSASVSRLSAAASSNSSSVRSNNNSKKKSTSHAVRPKSAAVAPANASFASSSTRSHSQQRNSAAAHHPVGLYASTNSASSAAANELEFIPGRSGRPRLPQPQSHRPQLQSQHEEVDIASMRPHSVERTTHPNGQPIEMHHTHSYPPPPSSNHPAHSAHSSQYGDAATAAASASPVKKAWVHEHSGGSVNVSVVGYVEQSGERGSPNGSPSALESSMSRARQQEYSRAQDVARLRRREEAQEAVEEADRLRMLQLQHQEYATQNSPHVDRGADGRDSYAQQQQPQQQYHQQQHEYDLELELQDAERDHQSHPPQPFGSQSQYEMLSASQQQRLRRRGGQDAAVALAPPHVVGDEHGLNESFSRVDEPRVQAQRGFNQAQGGELGALNQTLSQIADRNDQTAKKAMGSARKQPRPQQHQQSQQQQRHQPHEQPRASPSASGLDGSSSSQVSSLLANVAPSLSTPLETRLFSMLETIQAKMAAMETNMAHMESKLAARAGDEAKREEQEAQAQAQKQGARQAFSEAPRAALDYSMRSGMHPPPSVAPSGGAGAGGASSFRSQQHGGGPIANPLQPHPAHLYTPSTSFFGAPRGPNVNQIPVQQQHQQQHAAAQQPHGYATPAPAAVPPALPFAHAYPHLSASGGSRSRHSSPPRFSAGAGVDVAAPAAAAASAGLGAPSSPPRPGFAPHSPTGAHSHPSHRPQGRTPVRVPVHVPPHTFSPTRGQEEHMLPSRIPGVQVGNSVLSGGFGGVSGVGGVVGFGSGGAVGGPVASSFAHSSFDPSHSSLGSASLSRESVIPSTDSFIEQLKQRLRHTEDLIHTARVTAKATDSYNHYSQ